MYLSGNKGRQAEERGTSGMVALPRELAGPKATKYLTDLGNSSTCQTGDCVSHSHQL